MKQAATRNQTPLAISATTNPLRDLAPWIAAAILALCSAAWAAPIAPAPTPANTQSADICTQHYDIHVEGLDAREIGDMLEQLHDQLQTYFGTAPQGRLSVGIYATRERWQAALQADRQYVPPSAGGYYSPYTKKAYLWLQPTAYFTRHLILHEVTHQFHWLVATGNLPPSATWYTEGLAEYFAMHSWDGKHLHTGVIPTVMLEDYPATAAKHLGAAGWNLQKLLPVADRPEAWALISFLMEKYPAEFHTFSAKLDRQQDSVLAWKDNFGNDFSRISKEFHTWLDGHTTPWQIVWTSWQQRGDALESDSTTLAITVLKLTPKTLTVELEPETKGNSGLVFAYQSADDFHMLQILPNNKIRIVHRSQGQWLPVSTADIQPSKNLNILSLSQDNKTTTLWANNEKVGAVDAIGQVGLSADNCKTLFRIKDTSEVKASVTTN